MDIVSRFKDNSKRKMTLARNIKDIFFCLHNGRKTYALCFIFIALNWYLIGKGLSLELWIFILSSEWFLTEMTKKMQNEGRI